ncbi:MAG: hypothetical protein Kow0010_21080 [Dehalococcoidia bacterium]
MLAAVASHSAAGPSLAEIMDPFRLLNGTLGNGCWDWENDDEIWEDHDWDEDEEDDPFSDWWSGHERFWDRSTANECWHNDEGSTAGNPNRPGADYSGSAGTDVWFMTEHWNDDNWWPGVLFQSTGCKGVQVLVYDPNSTFLAKVHYWHIDPASGVIGSNWTYHYDVPGYSKAYRKVGDIASSDPYGTIYGSHLHQSADDDGSGWPSLPNRDGDIVDSTQFWLRWED